MFVQFSLTPPLAWDIQPGTIISIVLLVIYTIAQLLSNRDEKPAPKRPPRQRPRQPVQPGQPGQAGKPDDLEEKLRQEVDAFLRRASGQEPRPSEPKSPAAAGGRPQRTPPQKPPRRKAVSRPPMPSAAGQSEPAAPVLVPIRQGSVSDHVSQHIGSSSAEIAEQTSAPRGTGFAGRRSDGGAPAGRSSAVSWGALNGNRRRPLGRMLTRRWLQKFVRC